MFLIPQHCSYKALIFFGLNIVSNCVFLYLDRTFVLHNPTVTSLWDMGLEIFRDEVMNNDRVRKRSVDGLLKMIEQEREGAQVSLFLLYS
ncbi:hypothetical protein X798_07347 [Onchocerca flexuosa]|uniref:Cullin N-terminal domain-containing protein n=1 Tax=Onchocerca flexuosa TaxID=387005 RepID=A0A238BMF5_9BILA|nr:hypothetical protein X798_07347 [Onchocerca flexuosa]